MHKIQYVNVFLIDTYKQLKFELFKTGNTDAFTSPNSRLISEV